MQISNNYTVKDLPKISDIEESMTVFAHIAYSPDAKLYTNLTVEYKYTKTHINSYDIHKNEYTDYYFEAIIDNEVKIIRYSRPTHSTFNRLRYAIKTEEIVPGEKIKVKCILSKSLTDTLLYTDKCDYVMERFISMGYIH
ncbi:MAG: hypothetical protein IKR19_08800 [Acholeplasmatales bacterium]|nr:hypothetical protein [Acholeplasmatales bacterium]